jgi:hypothetical protein
MSIGGRYESHIIRNTYVYNAELDKWTLGPSFKANRDGLSCGILKVQDPVSNRTQKVVVAAGGKGHGGFHLSPVELLYINEDDDYNKGGEWVAGPELPKAAYDARMISVILIGGRGDPVNGIEVVDGFQLYQLFSANVSWIEMRQRLKTNRFQHVAFSVPDELVNCHRKK